MEHYAKYILGNPDTKVLDQFRKGINSFGELQSFISAHQSDPLLFGLYTTAAKKAKEGQLESGRGALGRGEVLIGMLSGGESGGTGGADNQIGGVSYEVKASKAKDFKIPLAAKRIDRFISLSKLDDLYFICKPVLSLKAWDDFLDTVGKLAIGGELSKKGGTKTKMNKYLFDAGIAPSAGNINQTELNNLELFFIGASQYFNGEEDNQDLYIDIDSVGGDDVLIRGKLDTPSSLNKLKKGQKLSVNVTNTVTSNIRDIENFQNKLKQHPYVIDPAAFVEDLRKDMNNILKNRYIILHETSGQSTVPVPVLLDETTGKELTITGFTLNQAAINFKDILK